MFRFLRRSAGRRWVILPGGSLVCVALAAVLLGKWIGFWPQKSGEELLSDARSALAQRQFKLAGELAAEIPREDPAWARGRLVEGEVATVDGRPERAIECYASVPRDGSEDAILAAFSLAEVCRTVGRLTEAEQGYAYVLAHRPDNIAAHERMAFLLNVTGRRWESQQHFLELLRLGDWTLESLILFGDLERPIIQTEYLQHCSKGFPDEIPVQLGLAAQMLTDGQNAEARELLEALLSRTPGLVAAQVMLGGLLVNSDTGTFNRWHSSLLPAADNSADVWYLRGLRARRLGELSVAGRCFWESLRRAPTHRRSTYMLGQVLSSLGHKACDEFAARAAELSELTRELDEVVRSDGRNERSMRRVVELMEACGRDWEAWAWATTAARFFPRSEWAQAVIGRVEPRLRPDLNQVEASADLALKHDFSSFPGHGTLFNAGSSGTSPTVANAEPSPIRFLEAESAGVRFVYNNGGDLATRGSRMFEQSGGGVGVLDFDLDGFPDLYFPQGSEWRTGQLTPTPSAEFTDCLYHNRDGASFTDVAAAAKVDDRGFGQGCAVGDFDNDGYPDLYVANIGRNTLYHNNGDGTFSDLTESSGLVGDDWTASCAIVDLNADGLPDLFDVNYLTGPGVYDRICDGRGCSPKNFPGAPGRVHLNQGDGAFRHIPQATPRVDAKGLGVVAFDLATPGRPSLFIANDQVPNFLLRNVPSDDENNLQLLEESFLSGLAFNQDGVAMAGMGIAAEDVDGNHLLDFFVTNFKDESNTFYLQDSPGLFIDSTQAADLRAPSWPYVGWGTQFLDADLDGHPDLVLVNGHIDDYRDEGGEYHMRPQIFRNLGRAHFAELKGETAGPYFDKKFLGRGLSRLDWNRDGRMEFVVSNIGQPASLLENRSEGVGHFLNVRLHATTTARDAIGTVVEVVAADQRWTKQLLAGDGFMASNERLLQFGLGQVSAVEEVQIRWPSGQTTTLRDLPVDATIIVVEGRPGWSLQRIAEP